MSVARYIVGDSLTVLRSMPDASVDLVLTSPPFLALRSYLPSDHPDKGKELGSEATPGAFIDALLDHVEECRRVLAPHGSLCFELGDTYSGSGGSGGDYDANGLRAGQEKFKQRYVGDQQRPMDDRKRTFRSQPRDGYAAGGPGWPDAKSLCLIPELFRIALVYGFNPLTGRTTPRWRARNVVRWHRPNPPVGALGDKFRPATSDMVVACMSGKRYFDLDATRGVPSEWEKKWAGGYGNPGAGKQNADRADGGISAGSKGYNPAGAPPLDTWEPLPEEQALWDQWADDIWTIPTAPYAGAHYATWPPALCVRPIDAMTPRRVCRVCGEPSRRIVEKSEGYAAERVAIKASAHGAPSDDAVGKAMGAEGARFVARESGFTAQYVTLGWTDCGHDAWRNGVVLDPFAGSGTTLAVATGHGRDAIGIDLDARNAELALERIGGLFLTVEHHEAEPEAVA